VGRLASSSTVKKAEVEGLAACYRTTMSIGELVVCVTFQAARVFSQKIAAAFARVHR